MAIVIKSMVPRYTVPHSTSCESQPSSGSHGQNSSMGISLGKVVEI